MKEKGRWRKWSAVGFCDWRRSRRIPQTSQSPRFRSLPASRCGGDLVAMGTRRTVLSALRLSGATDGRRGGGIDGQTQSAGRDTSSPPFTPPGAARHLGRLLIARHLRFVAIASFRLLAALTPKEAIDEREDATFETLCGEGNKKKIKRTKTNDAGLSGWKVLFFLVPV